MALSRIIAIGDGSTTQFALNYPLGILSRSHVTCRVGSEVDGLGDPVYRTLTWIHDGLVEVGGDVVADGVQIVFDRTVPVESLYHDYENGVPIMEANLDESNKQTLMAVHQVLDGRFAAFADDINMNGFRLVNAGDAVDMQDVVTLQQLTDATGNAPAFAAIAQAAATAASASATSASDDADRAELAAASIQLSNYTATSNPTVNDDSGDGYSVGSEWWNTSTGARFGCTNATSGAAVWVSLTADLSELKSGAYETVDNIRLIPQQSQSVDYTLVLTDIGKHILHPSADTTGRTFTIPANSTVAFPIGTAITIVNQDGAGVLTIDINTDTLVLAGLGTTGSRTLAANGIATILKITSTIWMISGIGLT